MKRVIYLDWAAATPLDPAVRSAMEPYFSKYFYNPAATYLAGRDAKAALETARAEIAGLLGAQKPEIVFTAGGTEANNLAIQGVMRQYPGSEVLVSAVEHDSVLQPAGLFKNRLIQVLPSGVVDISKAQKMVTDQTVLISVMLVNNELGTIQPLHKVADLVRKIRKQRQNQKNNLPLYLHSDAAQAGNYLDLHVSRLGVDMMTINGGKVYGPRQSGALFIKAGVHLRPLIAGGGQERGLRSGTENLASAVGLAKALKAAQTNRQEQAKRVGELKELFATLLQKHLKTAVINGAIVHSAPHLLSVAFPGHDNERLMMELDEAGIQCAVGSACSASKDKPSHVLSAIGLSNALARSTLRFSLGRGNSESDIHQTVKQLVVLTGKHR